jgi:hypothetical protein
MRITASALLAAPFIARGRGGKNAPLVAAGIRCSALILLEEKGVFRFAKMPAAVPAQIAWR